MRSRFRPRLTYANVTATLALFVALGGGAIAAASLVGSDGKIHACVGKKGALSVVKPGGKCGPGRRSLTWNQQGRRGATGERGLQGKAGAAGPGAVKIDATYSPRDSNTDPNYAAANPVAVVGPWTIGLICYRGPDPNDEHAALAVKGPGNSEWSQIESLNDDPSPGNTAPLLTGAHALSPSSFTDLIDSRQAAVGDFARNIVSLFLTDGSTVATVSVNLFADARPLDETKFSCSERGSAIPTS